ncbi:glycosyltransferase family 2 protein [Patescibacteria group bacterium]|nr:glycosyltransferase family 2 protein [Patescibacteria group bacterium]
MILNIDADNQYDASEIPKLLEPILKDEADIVSGDRQVKTLDHMASSKKYGNMLGTWVVKKVSGLPIKDASSGFRAYSREAALRLNVISQHTYTHETIIQAANKNLRFVEVPVAFRRTERDGNESRLIGGVWGHVKKSGATIVRTYSTYRSLKTFFFIGLPFFLIGLFFILRFLYFYFFDSGVGHIQSLIIAAILVIVGFQVFIIGLVADGINANRKINEEILYRLKKKEYSQKEGE